MNSVFRAVSRPLQFLISSTSTSSSTVPSRSFCTCFNLQASTSSKAKYPPSLLTTGKPMLDNFATLDLTDTQLKKSKRKPKALSPTLPDTDLFQALKDVIPLSKRPTIINEKTASELVKAWGVHQMKNATVIEAYPGPGGLTKAFLELPNVKRVIIMEQSIRYSPYLLGLAKMYPEKLVLRSTDPFAWESYSRLEDEGLLDDIPKLPWKDVQPNLFFAAQLPNNRAAEQLLVQIVSASAGGPSSWLFKFGRMRMGFTALDSFWAKIKAPPGTALHHKLAVLLPILAEIERVPMDFIPVEQHFHKPRKTLPDVGAVEIVPRDVVPVKDYETLEYVTRHLFVAKNFSWQKGVAGLAVGAGNLIPKMVSLGIPDDGTLIVNNLTLDQWAIIANVFFDWPFKPQVMFDDMQFTQTDQ